MSERTAVYRLFAADNALLYVGISKTFGRRWHDHVATKPWWTEVHHQTIDWHADRVTAQTAETTAINTEGPRHNIRRRHPQPRKPRRIPRDPSTRDKHRYRAITPRPPDELRDRVQGAVAEMGTDLNALVIGLLRWWIGDSDKPPESPPRAG